MKKLITTTLFLLGITTITASGSGQYENQQQPPKVSTLYIALDSSGSMTNKFGWISETLANINQQLEERTNQSSQIQLYGFSNQSQLLAKGDVESILSGIKTMDKGAAHEDGLIPINQIASQADTKDAHIILFTDENRTPIERLKVSELQEKLAKNNITVHVVIQDIHLSLDQQIIDPEGSNVGLIDHQSYADTLKQTSNEQIEALNRQEYDKYCQQKRNGYPPKLCESESGIRTWSLYFGQPNDYYVNIALSTGGTVWDINKIKDNQEFFTQFITQLLSGNKDNIIYPPKVKITANTLDNKVTANQMVTFEATKNHNLMNNYQVEQLLWDFDGDGTIDDQGPITMYEFNQPGLHKVKLRTTYSSKDEYGNAKNTESMRIVSVKVEQ